MIRIILAAAALSAPAVPAFAQATVGVTHHEAAGAAAGRSPHRAYRAVAAADSECRAGVVHVPAGKLPHFGAARQDGCARASGLAAADAPRDIRRD